MTIAGALFLTVIALFFGWRYSTTYLDPDLAMFCFEGFDVGVYGRDYVDCKTPVVHGYFFVLSKIAGTISRVKFLHHTLIGLAAGTLLYLVSGNFFGALALMVLANTGWFVAFHGNVGQWPAVLIGFVLVGNLHPFVAATLWVLAVAWEPKLAFAAPVWALFNLGTLPYFVAWGIFAGVTWLLIPKQWREWLVEANITVPAAMTKDRKRFQAYPWVPWFTATGLLYIMPWAIMAVSSKPSLSYWLPALVFILLTGYGSVIRQNHLIPLSPWLAMAGISPWWVLVLVVVDFVSSGLYLGDIWVRFYNGMRGWNEDAAKVGEWLRDKPGLLWVNSMHSGIYILANKAQPGYGLVEQIEIREVSQRRKAMWKAFEESPPQWIVVGMQPHVKFYTKDKQASYVPPGYEPAAVAGDFTVYHKMITPA